MTIYADPLTRWLAGGPCPHWCAGGCTYEAEPTDPSNYVRHHYSPSLSAGALRVHLVQTEETTDPDAPTTRRDSVQVVMLGDLDTDLGGVVDAAATLRHLAHGLNSAAAALTGHAEAEGTD